MNEKVENPTEEQVDYSQLYHTKSPVKMIKMAPEKTLMSRR